MSKHDAIILSEFPCWLSFDFSIIMIPLLWFRLFFPFFIFLHLRTHVSFQVLNMTILGPCISFVEKLNFLYQNKKLNLMFFFNNQNCFKKIRPTPRLCSSTKLQVQELMVCTFFVQLHCFFGHFSSKLSLSM